MKKAFTMLELVFVVVIIGILSTFISPNFQRDTLTEAANQIVSHIRYTQHLAMMDNKFDATDPNWFKNRWQILFGQSISSDNEWAYAIFNDTLGAHSGNPDPAEIAKNPTNQRQVLSGGFSGTLAWDDENATRTMNIGKTYGVTAVTFSNCGGGGRRMAFDHLGRPIRGNLRTMNLPYESGRILNTTCNIILTNSNGETITISIERETGYTHIL